MRCQMMRVISSPSISTTGFFTLIFAIADEPLRARICDGRSAECLRVPALWRGGAHPARPKHMRAELRARTRRAIVRSMAFAAGRRRSQGHARRDTLVRTCAVGIDAMPTWREIRGAYGRGRRALRQAMLEPVLVGWPVLRDVVMNALAARGHLVLCELGDVRFFVDPSDRVVGAWLMWHGGWQRREIDAAVEVLSAAQRLPANAVFVDVGAHIGTHTIYAL